MQRKQYHENTDEQYLKRLENSTDVIEADEIMGSMYIQDSPRNGRHDF